jgi:tRNA pseudouridine32 synthase/23S rRNA pseudouridine746 synthase/23S rRNA pseudouridine1911/1915/1917 synthase
MQENNYPTKKVPKKHQPNGLTILFEDQDILVVDKVVGLLTIGTESERHKTAHYILNDYVKKGNERSKNRVFIVHRLDRDTSGILVFAKSEKAKRYLQDNWKEFSKKYVTVVHGVLPEKEGEITSYLTENKAFRVYSVKEADKGRFSKTAYKVIKESAKYSLLEINLFTGRKNQIRVHLAEHGHPIVGDKTYGMAEKGIKRLALHSLLLTISHPFTHKEMTFTTEVPAYFNALVNYRLK